MNKTTETHERTVTGPPLRTFRVWELAAMYRELGLPAPYAEQAAVADLVMFRRTDPLRNPQQHTA